MHLNAHTHTVTHTQPERHGEQLGFNQLEQVIVKVRVGEYYPAKRFAPLSKLAIGRFVWELGWRNRLNGAEAKTSLTATQY